MTRRVFRSAMGLLLVASFFAASGQTSADLGKTIEEMRQALRDLHDKLEQLEKSIKSLEKDRKRLEQAERAEAERRESERRKAEAQARKQEKAERAKVAPPPDPAVAKAGAEPPKPAEPASPFVTALNEYRRGRAAESAGDCAQAIQSYSIAIQLDPGNDSALFHRALCQERLARQAEALQDINQSLKIQPENAEAYAFRARLHRQAGRIDLAAADLEQAALRDPKPETLASLNELLRQSGDEERMVAVYREVLQAQPMPPSVLLQRAADFQSRGQLRLALVAVDAALKVHPYFAEGYIRRAEIRNKLNQRAEALGDLELALKIDPNSGAAKGLLAELQAAGASAQPAQPGAAPAANSPVSTKPVSTPPQATPAPAMPAQPGDSKPVEPRPVEPMRSEPNPAQPKPVAEMSARVPDEPARGPVIAPAVKPPQPTPAPAVSAMSAPGRPAPSAIVAAPPRFAPPPTDPKAAREAQRMIYWGRKNSEQGRYEDAIVKLTRAIELDPRSALAYNSRGFAHLKAGRHAQAIQDFESAVRLDSKYANAAWNLGVTLKLTGKRDAGIGYMQRAAELQRDAYAGLLDRQLRSR